ncbi:Lrp/AsnC family transcriptional regulator [Acidihalobacter ferrooxydans]|uniref:AsnC family transcriptional regulator n=1 Tax=Acidihalobacter ferrooxydans TaxID=1765967 RepID=A0A1P8UEP9_9GAMM|nr:Lrp/AsnC family transcriptional regulator [Acidihalobacter ferrooxydans]APZ42332.1 AsnC family transcriptional regulator [Acidihalobacter ferrooxydans]
MQPAPEMDARDRRILRLLQENGRLTNADLAEKVNLSPSACLRRVRQLEDSGVIERYAALLSRDVLHQDGTAIIFMRMERQNPDIFRAFEEAVHEIPEVMECYLMAGEADYMLKVVYTDAKDFERIYVGSLLRLPGVAGTQSHLALRRVYSSPTLPI